MDYTLYPPSSATSGQTTTTHAPNEAAPPSSNTGVLTGKPSQETEHYGPMDSTALVDAFCFTFGDLVTVDMVKALPEFAGMKWIQMERGDLAYKSGIFCDGICILSDGLPGMGVHTRMMGQACRTFEGRSQFEGWHTFFRRLRRYKLPVQLRDEEPTEAYYSAKVTRLDIAMDDSSGRLDMERINKAREECTIVSTYRLWRNNEEGSLKSGKSDGFTITFGKRTGESVLRFYDRAAKMKLPASEGPLIRCELELHDEAAVAFIEQLIDGADLGKLTAGVVRRKMDFKDGPRPERSGGSEYRAWKTVRWWDEFLGGVEKMRLGVAPIVRTLQKGKDWLMRQASALLATVVDTGDWDLVGQMMIEGRKKRPKWQQRAIDEGCWSSEVVYSTIEENVRLDPGGLPVQPLLSYAVA